MTFRAWSVSVGAVAVLSAGGCGKAPVVGPAAPAAREAENPWAKAVSALRKETDVGTCRRVLAEIGRASCRERVCT